MNRRILILLIGPLFAFAQPEVLLLDFGIKLQASVSKYKKESIPYVLQTPFLNPYFEEFIPSFGFFLGLSSDSLNVRTGF